MKGQPLLVLSLIFSSWTLMRINVTNHNGLADVSIKPDLRIQDEASHQYAKTKAKTFIRISARRERSVALIPKIKSVFISLAPARDPYHHADFTQALMPIIPFMSLTERFAPPALSPSPLMPVPAPRADKRQLSGSFWLLTRSGGANATSSPTLGASQLGARILIPLQRIGTHSALSGSLRASAPLAGRDKEIGAGLSVKLTTEIPVEFTAERRFSLASGQGDRWALFVASGVNDVHLTKDLSIDAYGQAGLVGFKRQEFFAGGSMNVRKDLHLSSKVKTSLGAGLWADAQRGASRVDIGPEISAKFSDTPLPLRISAQWRFRVAGNAKPASGPALVIAGDF